jgi:hypothetical protein
VLLYIIDPAMACTINSLDAIKRICQGRQVVLVLLERKKGRKSTKSTTQKAAKSEAADEEGATEKGATEKGATETEALDLTIHRKMVRLLQAIAVEHGIAIHTTTLEACESICQANHVSINNPGKLAYRDKVNIRAKCSQCSRCRQCCRSVYCLTCSGLL